MAILKIKNNICECLTQKTNATNASCHFYVGMGWFAYWEDFPSLLSLKGTHIRTYVMCGNEWGYRARAGHGKSVGKLMMKSRGFTASCSRTNPPLGAAQSRNPGIDVSPS